MKATREAIYEKAKEFGYNDTQAKRKNSILALEKYLLNDSVIQKTDEKLGREFYYEFLSWDAIKRWIEANKVPKGYVALKKADEFGLSYFTARNRCIQRGIPMETFGFGTERKIYIKEYQMRELTQKVIL